jgi:pyrroloquinoline-quinone synthase
LEVATERVAICDFLAVRPDTGDHTIAALAPLSIPGGTLLMDFFADLEAVRARWNVLEHPFYARWSRGELTADELAHYAGEYHHAVVALAEGAARAAATAEPPLRAKLEAHAAEEASHVALWEEFTTAVGGAPSRRPAAETAECAGTWAGDGERELLPTLVALYAIESGQPAISATKRDGLKRFYGFEDGPATAYFDLHETLDVEHSAAERRLIEERLEGADHDALLAEAESVLKANWNLLDGVDRVNGRRAA